MRGDGRVGWPSQPAAVKGACRIQVGGSSSARTALSVLQVWVSGSPIRISSRLDPDVQQMLDPYRILAGIGSDGIEVGPACGPGCRSSPPNCDRRSRSSPGATGDGDRHDGGDRRDGYPRDAVFEGDRTTTVPLWVVVSRKHRSFIESSTAR